MMYAVCVYFTKKLCLTCCKSPFTNDGIRLISGSYTSLHMVEFFCTQSCMINFSKMKQGKGNLPNCEITEKPKKCCLQNCNYDIC